MTRVFQIAYVCTKYLNVNGPNIGHFTQSTSLKLPNGVSVLANIRIQAKMCLAMAPCLFKH